MEIHYLTLKRLNAKLSDYLDIFEDHSCWIILILITFYDLIVTRMMQIPEHKKHASLMTQIL